MWPKLDSLKRNGPLPLWWYPSYLSSWCWQLWQLCMCSSTVVICKYPNGPSIRLRGIKSISYDIMILKYLNIKHYHPYFNVFYVHYYYRTLKGRGLPGSSVVFRQGTNVEIGPPSFMASSAEGANGVSSSSIDLNPLTRKRICCIFEKCCLHLCSYCSTLP